MPSALPPMSKMIDMAQCKGRSTGCQVFHTSHEGCAASLARGPDTLTGMPLAGGGPGGAPEDSFPRQQARTQRFSLGRPRSFTISPDGARVAFLRSFAGDDPVMGLWALDLPDVRERLRFDPRQGGGGEGHLAAEGLALGGRGPGRGGGG